MHNGAMVYKEDKIHVVACTATIVPAHVCLSWFSPIFISTL